MPSSTPRWPRSVCSAAALCKGSLALGVACVCMYVFVVWCLCVCVCAVGGGGGVHVCVVPCSMMCTVGLQK